jgi:hypothetical protein
MGDKGGYFVGNDQRPATEQKSELPQEQPSGEKAVTQPRVRRREISLGDLDKINPRTGGDGGCNY